MRNAIRTLGHLPPMQEATLSLRPAAEGTEVRYSAIRVALPIELLLSENRQQFNYVWGSIAISVLTTL